MNSLPSMPHSLLTLSILAAFNSPQVHASSVDILPSSQSYTGLMFTPNAQVIKTGDISLSFHQGIPFRNKISQWDNWFFATGLFPNFELGGRIVVKNYSCNGYTTKDKDCLRDLSASAKFQLPYVYDFTGFNVAIGAQDIGGAANNFDTKYIAADKTFDSLSLRLSGGYGSSVLANGIMNGPFAGAEWQPLSFMQLTAEYDAAEFNSNAKLFTPQGLLPRGSQLSLDYQVYTGHERSEQDLWGINFSVPLMGYNDNTALNLTTSKNEQLAKKVNQQLAQASTASLANLINALKEEDFINLNVGYRNNKMVIALENRRYNHNQLDGVGVALGIIASKAGDDVFSDLAKLIKKSDSKANIQQNQEQRVELILLTSGLPMFAVNTETQCYREFIQSDIPCKQLSFNTISAKPNFEQTTWLYQTMNSGFGRSQVILSPALNHRTATEYGFFDYSLALAANLYTPLWQGAAVDLRYMVPIDNSDDFDQGGLWYQQAFENKLDRALIHQAFKLPQNIITQFSGGYMMDGYWGGVNETQWYSPQGDHMLGFEASKFISKDEYDTRGRKIADKQSVLANYTYSLPEYNWQLGLQAGEYFQGDVGARVTSNHWLGDTKLSINYLTSKAKGSSEYEDFVAVSIAIPLTPWRDMKPDYVQVRGIDQFVYSLQTRVGESHNNLNSGLGASSDLQHNIIRQYENRGRLSPAYFKANTQRLRNAYIKYVKVTVE
ncbi:YjbH domain-containing protein [Photobacterium angustum]|uniref:YjbH domain-containing protein n=1 Tax=Photobacterium angustum TaxID=661 RepID=UPI0005DB2B04|nr:YjbH domain-containing protein [Photobacterium angustum]KJG18218.1 hypothetical protein UA33_05035 [Photobacterium angustum]KJG26310.1 hypothetical protein UA39_01015 [Photobacterium angustum]KJG32320.1 hypothetical protein UA36_07650 [Photobacterium angustum]PSW93462.1 hypothetical protein C0W79_17840 [Photobacterium angustum]PSX02440.1 hypothetical protein C0W87_09205 [Photobacterium angustum]